MGFSGGTVGKELSVSGRDTRDIGSIPESGRSLGGGPGKPTPVFLPGESHGQRRPVGYSPWGRKELDTIEQLSKYIYIYIYIYTHTHTHIHFVQYFIKGFSCVSSNTSQEFWWEILLSSPIRRWG